MLAVAGTGFVVWGLSIGMRPLGDNSFLTHLATGRLILARGIPRTDPYSFTAHGHPWVVQSWLASTAFAWLERVVGLAGVRLLLGVTAGALAGLVWRLGRPASSVVARVAIAGLAVGVGTGMWVGRPLLFGLALMAVLLVAAEGGLDPRWLVPAMWVWVNLHGSFPLGLACLVCLTVGRRLDGECPSAELAALKWAVLGTLFGAVNPLGPRLLVFPLEPLRRSGEFRQIIEWQAPKYHASYEKIFVLQLVVAAILLVRHRRWRVAIPMVVFGAAALTSLRNIPVASLVLVPGMAACAHGLGALDGRRRSRMAVPAMAALATLAVVTAMANTSGPPVNLHDYPTKATAWMRAHRMLGVGGCPGSRGS